jgi:hypothetical protein
MTREKEAGRVRSERPLEVMSEIEEKVGEHMPSCCNNFMGHIVPQ